jgi:hypothetical protein
MSKEPTKREDLPKSEQGQPGRAAGVRDVPDPKEGQAEAYERRERGAKGEPLPEDFDKGEYHGLTPQQIKKIEDARYDDADDVTTVDGADSQADEQKRLLDKENEAREKEERDRKAKEKEARSPVDKAEHDRKTKEREKEDDHGKVHK